MTAGAPPAGAPPVGDGTRVIVVGAGILGTMHAVMARRAGAEVILTDRHTEPRGATVRNFGLVWVSGRAPGAELEVALRARALWAEIGGEVPGVGWRADGSLTVVDSEPELRVLMEVAESPDASARQVEVVDAAEARRINPALHGEVLAALWCRADGVVEPRRALPALRAALETGGGFEFAAGETVVEIAPGVATLAGGRRLEGDVVIVCPGAETGGPIAELVRGAPLRRCRLQMMQTAPMPAGERLATSLADGDSLRYYPAFATPSLPLLPPQDELAARMRMQLLVSQRAGGELTIGDTHDYDEPFPFDLDEAAYGELARRTERLLGRPLPAVRRRWAGVYSQITDGSICWRHQVDERLVVVTGPGGRGMTLSPAIAEATCDALGLGNETAAVTR